MSVLPYIPHNPYRTTVPDEHPILYPKRRGGFSVAAAANHYDKPMTTLPAAMTTSSWLYGLASRFSFSLHNTLTLYYKFLVLNHHRSFLSYIIRRNSRPF